MIQRFVAVLAALVILAAPASAAVNLGPLETISVAVDDKNEAGWWSPLDEFNGRTYLAYNTDPLDDAARHNVWITRRDPSGSYVRGCLPAASGDCARFVDDLGHNQPSLAVDGDGYIHVFAAMHNSTGIIYYRSARPEDPTQFVNRSAEMPDRQLRFTYPNATRGPNGDVWLIIRSRTHDAWAGARLYRWTNAANSWSLISGASFAYEDSPRRTVYPDDVQVSPDGDVHIAFEWAGNANGIRHEASYLRYRPSTGTFHVAGGAQVAVPVTPATPGLVYQPMAAGEIYDVDGPGVQSAKLTLYQSGSAWLPTIAYRYREPGSTLFKVRRARFTGGAWNRTIVYGGPTPTTAAIDITHDGTTERIYYVRDVSGGTAVVAESTGGAWTETPIAAGKPVRRLSVLMRADGTDVAYLCAPRAISSRRGELYFRTIGR